MCLLDTLVSHVKKAESTDLPFGMWTRVDLRNHVVDGDRGDRGAISTVTAC